MAVLDILEQISAGETRTVLATGSDTKIINLIITNTEGTAATINIKKKFNDVTVQRYMKDTNLDSKASFIEDQPIYLKANTELIISTDKNIDVIIEGESL